MKRIDQETREAAYQRLAFDMKAALLALVNQGNDLDEAASLVTSCAITLAMQQMLAEGIDLPTILGLVTDSYNELTGQNARFTALSPGGDA